MTDLKDSIVIARWLEALNFLKAEKRVAKRSLFPRDAYFSALNEAQLRESSVFWSDQFRQEETGFCDPKEAAWHYESRFPLSQLATASELKNFMREEMKNWADCGEPTRFSDMIHQPIGSPIFVLMVAGLGYIWDGNHRAGACALSGRKSIPAIVGTPYPAPLPKIRP